MLHLKSILILSISRLRVGFVQTGELPHPLTHINTHRLVVRMFTGWH